MHKIFIASLFLLCTLQSCYEDYLDDYDYSATYFAFQYPFRNVVLDNNNSVTVEIGAALGGRLNNNKNEYVEIEIDPSMLDDYPELELLPEDYYTISNSNEIVIPKGEFVGTIDLTLNEHFIADDKAHDLHYVLPIKIINSTTDSVLHDKNFTMLAISYQSMMAGEYYIFGERKTFDQSGILIEDSVYTRKKYESSTFRSIPTYRLNTISSTEIEVPLKNNSSDSYKLKLIDENKLTIESYGENSYWRPEVTGSGTYDRNKKIFTVNYEYSQNNERCVVSEVMEFIDNKEEFKTWEYYYY